MKRMFLFLTSWMLISICSAQDYKMTDFGLKTDVGDLTIELTYFGPSIVRIVKYPKGEVFIKQSLSVISSPVKTKFDVKSKADQLIIDNKSIQIHLNTKTGQISFLKNGVALLTEGQASFEDFVDAGTKTYTVGQGFVLEKDEAIYGLGQQQQGKMSKRGVDLRMIQGNTSDYIPFVQSSKGYGVYWDNYSPTNFNDTPESTWFKSDVGDGIDYYFMFGGNADGVISCMRTLTGQVPMFPLWTYGFWQSKERYKSQEELLGVVKKYRSMEVPLDGIIQDWQYWGNNYLWNAMDFLNPGFPNAKKMINDVHNMNAHMIISIWNSFGPKTKQYRELDSIKALFDFDTWPQSGIEEWPPRMDYPSGVRVYDAYNPVARDIFWKYLDQGIFSLGIDGWWIDSSEPDHFNPKKEDFDSPTYLGSFRKVRNAFPLMTVGGIAEHQLQKSKEKRVFILTRSAFAGQQRYGSNLWSGDVVASWQALRNQISAGLNVSLSNMPHWNSDIGGFFLWNFRNPLQNVDYRELHVRWMQFGAFCPMMRSHGEGAPREIFQFGEKGNPTVDAIEKYIKLRYRMLPYIYSTSWEVSHGQSSMMRALVMDFAQDKKALDLNDEYLFGKAILVSPVTTPKYWKPVVNGKDTTMVEDFSIVKSKEVYLPSGSDWFDFWTGEKHKGGQTVSKAVPLDILPVFIKAGSILPWGPEVQFATEKNWDNLEIRVYEGANGSFTLYEDENDNYNYENSIYSTIDFKWDEAKKTLTIGDRSGKYPGMLEKRKFNIVFVSQNKGSGMGSATSFDKVVHYDGRKISVKK